MRNTVKRAIAFSVFAIVVLSAFMPGGSPAGGSTLPADKKEQLSKILGRWITLTTVHPKNGIAGYKTIGSDVYQWSPDGNFIVHTAYGVRNTTGYGAMEIIGYDPSSGDFNSYNFNPDGSFNIDKLTIKNGVWVWTGKTVRSTGAFNKEGKTFTVNHDMTTNGTDYEPFMDGVLSKGAGP